MRDGKKNPNEKIKESERLVLWIEEKVVQPRERLAEMAAYQRLIGLIDKEAEYVEKSKWGKVAKVCHLAALAGIKICCQVWIKALIKQGGGK